MPNFINTTGWDPLSGPVDEWTHARSKMPSTMMPLVLFFGLPIFQPDGIEASTRETSRDKDGRRITPPAAFVN
jgi:hypothetical protein